ncbi:MAG: hypothetical protein QG666_1125, partial [Euryarchaeota archaeon]|nr:hypothetical protein [Euryarchaeota archaeon]
NGNNRYDLDEGCPGWTITITGPGVDQTKNTDENGVASFDIGFKTDSARPNELPKNQYIIHEKPKDNWENVVDQSITLGPNEGKTVDIENTPLPGIIVVHKFEDKNDNGNPDAGEEGAGWTFRVQGKGVRNPTATTNESGMASFIVDFKSDAGSACQPQTQELIIHEVPKNCYEVQPDQQIELSPGKRQDRTFVNRIPPVTLAIQKFYDANKNAVLDPGEDDGEKYPLSGWQYEIAYQGNVQSLTTDRGGTTSITLPVSVPEAACTIREVTDRPGWICTTTNPRQIKISCENPTLKVEFGNKADRIVIKKFNDSNINSKQDDGEDGLPGWKFDIMSPDGSTTTIGPTNNDGITMKEGLLPGSYAIREVLQDGWINTTPLYVSVDVRAGEDALVPAFGNIKSSRIELFKFNDTDKNGEFDSYENGLSGWMFAVRCPNGSVVTSRPTNAKGVTSLERLTPGVYTVTENLVEGWINTTPFIKSINLSIGDEEKLSFGNYYCLPCHRFENRMPPMSTDGDAIVTKNVSNLSTENINRVSGNEVSYNITICPTRRIDEIASIPTDIVIAVDNSPSIINMRKSAVDGVRKLAEDIAANDKSHVTRIGLVSWSDENNSGVEVPLIDNYTEVAGKASKITFAEGKYTKYGIGIDKSTEAFDEDSAGKEKKIVIITDASDNGYVEPRFTDIDLSGYSIFAIVVGEKNETKALAMLNELTGKHRGYVIPINDLSELGEALVKTATAGSLMKNVHLVEVLPNYLALNNSTAIDDGGRVTLNGDSKDWTTTTITWDIGDLSDCWSTDFRAVFCWKLPADANQPQRNSYVNYTDEQGMSRTLALPEHE